MRLVRIPSPDPVAEPVSTAEAKEHARVLHDEDDLLIARLIAAARAYCETRIKAALVPQRWTLLLDGFPTAGGYYNRAVRDVWAGMGGLPAGFGFHPGMIPNSTGVIDLPMSPLRSVEAVEYFDFNDQIQTVDPSIYVVSAGSPGRIQPTYSKVWPIARPTIEAVRIQFTAGPDPGDAPEACVQTVILMLVAHWYENREAVSAVSMGTVPLAVDALLAPADPGVYA